MLTLLSRRPGPPARLLAAASCLAMVLAGCGAAVGANQGSGSSGSGLAFYKGKTITFISPDSPGGGLDVYARLIAPYLAKYLGATVRVTDIPAGATIEGTNTLGHATPNGLTIGLVNLNSIFTDEVEAGNPSPSAAGVTFDVSKLEWIAGKGPAPGIIGVLSSTPYHTFQQVREAKDPVTVLNLTQGSSNLQMEALIHAYDLNVKVISGYENSKSLLAGLLRGDGQITALALSAAAASMRQGTVRPILMNVADDPRDSMYNTVKDLPTLQQLFTASPPPSAADRALFSDYIDFASMSTGLAAPPGTPQDRVSVLIAAIKHIFQEPAVIAAGLKQSLVVNWTGPSAVASYVKTAYSRGKNLKSWLK